MASHNFIKAQEARKIDPEICHACGEQPLPSRGFFDKLFNPNIRNHALFCHLCLKMVCSSECLHQHEFVIPRDF
jgi:hypothetical protein